MRVITPAIGGGGGGGGTVTSVGLVAPGIFTVTGSPVIAAGNLGLVPNDPGADRIVFWDDSASDLAYLTVGSGLSIVGTTISATGGGTGDVVGPAGATDGRVVAFDGATGKLIKQGTQLVVDLVSGPASATADGIATYNGTTGKLIKDGVVTIAALQADTAAKIAGPGVVTSGRTVVFSGTTGLVVAQAARLEADLVAGPAASTADRIAVWNGAGGKTLKDGTKLEADVVTGPASVTDQRVAAFNGTTGKVIQQGTQLVTDLVTGPGSAVSGNVASFNGTTGKIVQDAGFLATAVARKDQINVFTKNQSVAAVALTDAATIATDASLGNNFKCTLGGNRTLGAPTNPTEGMVCNWWFTQDGTGNRTLAYNAAFKFPSGTAPVLSTAAGAKDGMSCYYDGAVWLCVANKTFS